MQMTPTPHQAWQPQGTVYGTLLNFRREWDLWSARMTQDPHKAAPKASVLYVKTANTFCPAGQDLQLQDGVSEVDILQNGISEGLGQIGADQTVVDLQNTVLDQVILRLKTTRSDVEDLDYTEAITRMNKDQLALEAAQSSFAKISQLSLFKFLS